METMACSLMQVSATFVLRPAISVRLDLMLPDLRVLGKYERYGSPLELSEGSASRCAKNPNPSFGWSKRVTESSKKMSE
jgi:hypothetical protein